MKLYFKLTKLTSFLLFFLFIQKGTAQNIAINTDGTNPDASAMLDIVSANKGLLMPRIALTTTTDATTITSPATGLLVYNTTAGITGSGAAGTGFYYNAGTTGSPVWTKLVTDATSWKTSGNSGTDSANNFIGTTDGESLMIKTNNTRRINISGVGETTIGNGTDQVKVSPAGDILLEGTATVYNDMVVTPVSTYNKDGASGPQFATFKGSLQALTFVHSSEQQVFFSIQMPHNWKEGSAIYPHIHWSPQSSTSGAVRWGFEYTWVNYDAATPIAFPANTTAYATSESVVSGDVDKHLITMFSSITPASNQNKISSILMCRLFRNSSNGADTYNGSAALLSFDIHYQIDAIGSRTEYAK